MPKKRYGKLEKKVLDLFPIDKHFFYTGQEYIVRISGKPRSSKGEPKTDVYISAENVNDGNKCIVFKISCKLEKANEFQENKIQAARAEEIWGDNWERVINEAAWSLQDDFLKTQVFFPKGTPRTKETMLTNGWKVEITNKYRALSSPLDFSEQEVRDIIYKGVTLDTSKKNCIVNGQCIENSGVAEFILVSTPEKLNSELDVLNNIQCIDNYPIIQHYIVFTGNNLRVLKNKYDGTRQLGVQIFWNVDAMTKELTYNLNFNNPLDPNYSSKQISNRTQRELKKLDVSILNNFI